MDNHKNGNKIPQACRRRAYLGNGSESRRGPKRTQVERSLKSVTLESVSLATTRTYFRSGSVRSRRLADGEPTWEMGLKAAEEAVKNSGIDPMDIGLVIDTTIMV